MTVENWLSQMGFGTKQLTERYAEYPAPVHDQQMYYTYEPSLPSHGHAAPSKHHYGGGGHKNNGAMSALTLLAFLFFLHILQQCLKEHMTSMSTPQVMVVSAGREEQNVAKFSNKHKFDKTGVANEVMPTTEMLPDVKMKDKINDIDNTQLQNDSSEDFFMKVQTAEHTPHKIQNKNKLTSNSNKSSIFTGYISTMEEN
ncbi:uncharacterized protein [Epargyreus clarus]|uniref:uncharacterized protein n=1 Tax=Epargyreus clarus TaxID=520877 RepID=UPI003C2EC69A